MNHDFFAKGFDLPDMFRQMTEKLWKQFSKERATEDIRIPEKVLLECNELVLNGDSMEEVQRLPGENDVIIFKDQFEFCNLISYLNVFRSGWLRGE